MGCDCQLCRLASHQDPVPLKRIVKSVFYLELISSIGPVNRCRNTTCISVLTVAPLPPRLRDLHCLTCRHRNTRVDPTNVCIHLNSIFSTGEGVSVGGRGVGGNEVTENILVGACDAGVVVATNSTLGRFCESPSSANTATIKPPRMATMSLPMILAGEERPFIPRCHSQTSRSIRCSCQPCTSWRSKRRTSGRALQPCVVISKL